MKKLMSLLMALMVAFAMFPTFHAHAQLADGKYSLPYQVNKSGSTSASISNDYFIKPATLVKKDGVMYVQLTINKSSQFVQFESDSGGNKVVATDEANDRRTVQFNVTDLSKPQTVRVRIEIPAEDYYHNYKIDFVWYADKSKLIEAYAAPVKEAAKPAEAKPTETKKEVTETKQAEKPVATESEKEATKVAEEPKKEEVKKEEVKTDESTQQEATKQEVVEESSEEVKKEAPKATDEQPATEDKKQQDTIVVASAQANDQATSNETVQQTTEESGSNTIMWIIIALAVVFAGTGGYGFYKKLSSKK